MADLLTEVESHFTSLTATNEVCSNFGSTFTSNTNIFKGVVPSSPTDCVVLLPYGGRPPDTRHRSAQYPSIQVRVRATGYAKGYKTTQAIINHLHQNGDVCSSFVGIPFAVQSQPIFLAWDEEKYPVFVCNFDFNIIKYSVS